MQEIQIDQYHLALGFYSKALLVPSCTDMIDSLLQFDSRRRTYVFPNSYNNRLIR